MKLTQEQRVTRNRMRRKDVFARVVRHGHREIAMRDIAEAKHQWLPPAHPSKRAEYRLDKILDGLYAFRVAMLVPEVRRSTTHTFDHVVGHNTEIVPNGNAILYLVAFHFPNKQRPPKCECERFDIEVPAPHLEWCPYSDPEYVPQRGWLRPEQSRKFLAFMSVDYGRGDE